MEERSLLERWRKIEAEDYEEDEDGDEKYRRAKESWFPDAFAFLNKLPPESHCWCQHRDVTMPLLEPFYNFFKASASNKPSQLLWNRLSSELRACTTCISQYYQVKEYYKTDFVESVISPILAVIWALDVKRVVESMQRVLQGTADSREVVCVLFEMFTYPELLEDATVNDALIPFLRHVSNTHELQLSKNQRYPGLYALFFHSNQDVRRVALGLAKSLEPFSTAEDLEPLQPVLEKRFKHLETGEINTAVVGTTRDSMWLGLKTLLGFLQAPAIEDGIVERYPTFVGVVLNNVSENTSIFWNALRCLDLLLEVLEYKLWLKSAFSPGVLRNTLLSQCFHAKDEKTHKVVFDTFQHFLQSLEPMQDGQYERQRRNLLYFLLQQVPHSSNFSSFIRKYASQIACSIVLRSYRMDPSSPPFECLHFWGSTLLSIVKDTTIQLPLRQPALDLCETVLVADATALAALYRESRGHSENVVVEENLNDSRFSWSSFIQRLERDNENWCCAPLIWTEALESATLVLSPSFTKAFVWAVSRVSVLDRSGGGEVILSDTVNVALRWEKPTGCDDGGDGKVCKNAIKASVHLEELISLLKRSADAFAMKVRDDGRVADWVWEPALAEALLLLLMDSSAVLRQLGKELLQQFSTDNRLESGIRFLCESEESLHYAVRSFRHAASLVGKNPFENSSSLQHILFVAMKFYTIGQTWASHQWKSFSRKLSAGLWSLLVNCITNGQKYSAVKGYETCCSRMFELLPMVFKNMIPSAGNDTKQFDGIWTVTREDDCPGWFEVLVSWSVTTSISIRRRWSEAVVSILEDLARGAVSAKAGRSKTVNSLLQPGSVIDNDQRERLSLLFSTPPKVDDVTAVKNVVIHLDSDEDEDAPVVVDFLPKVKKDAIIIPSTESPVPPTQHKRPVRQVLQSMKQQSIREREQSKKNAFSRAMQSTRQQEELFKEQQPREEPYRQKQTSEEPYEQREPREEVHKQREPIMENAISREQPFKQREFIIEKATKPHQPSEPEFDTRRADEQLLNELVSDDGPDGLDAALDLAKKQRTSLATAAVVPKRKLVRLDMPAEQLKTSIPSRNKSRAQRPPPPKMDDWLMGILCIDLFDDKENVSLDLVEVPVTFKSSQHYIEVFRPLLLEEFKAQLQRSRQEVDTEDKEKVGMVNLMSLERVDSLHVARFLSEAGKDRASRACMENDLVLLSKQPFQQSHGGVHMLAKVERRERENRGNGTILLVKLFLPQTNERLVKAKSTLVNRSKWHITRLLSITPQLREFQAVSAMASSPFLNTVLSPISKTSWTSEAMPLPEALWRKLNIDYNSSQLSAIKASLGDRQGSSHQMSLIQGPPGTGKTRTIVAVVSALMHAKNCSQEAPKNSNNFRPRLGQTASVARSWQDLEVAKRMVDQNQQTRNKRVLVCAQSNAAVDELVSRLSKNGIYNSSGEFYMPEIVRSGNPSAIHQDSLPYFIDTLVKKKRGQDSDIASEFTSKNAVLQSKLEKVTEEINEASRKIAAGEQENEPMLMTQLQVMEAKKKALTMEVQKSQLSFKKMVEADRAELKQLRSKIIREADIVLTTLNGCGGDIYSACMENSDKGADVFFDAVVIDEAAQALEPATLIPLQLLAPSQGRCVMVGDPKQLPATVLSQAANQMSFERSMFERFQTNGYPVTMLTVQYRMHPDIRKFPSLYFYNNQLVDGEAVLGNNRVARFHKDKLFPPYAFLNVLDGKENSGGGLLSISNPDEVNVAVELFKCFKSRYPEEVSAGRIGVITPYKRQILLLKDAFRKNFGDKVSSGIDFNTIDGFQGRELDIVILSAVRASQECGKSIGFVADMRRMNVAMTRSRFSLWIIGNAQTLKRNNAWAALLGTGSVYDIQKPYSRYFSSTPVQDRIIQAKGETRKRSAEAVYDGNKRQKLDGGRPNQLERRQVQQHQQQQQQNRKEETTRLHASRPESRGIKLLDQPQAPRRQVSRIGSNERVDGRSEASTVINKNIKKRVEGGIPANNFPASRVSDATMTTATTRKAGDDAKLVRGPPDAKTKMEQRRQQLKEAAALLPGSLLDSKKPDFSARRRAAPPIRPNSDSAPPKTR